MGLKGLIRHVDGTTRQLTPYIALNRTLMSGPNTVATEDQIDAKEKKLDKYKQKEYMAHHIILRTILIRLSSTVKSLKSVKEMWDAVKKDAMTKSKMHQVDMRHQLQQSKCHEDGDVKAHLIEMVKLHDGMGTSIDEEEFSTVILGSLLASYHTILLTITVVASLSGKLIESDDLIHIILEEVNH